jgi:CheY-like chemotaxis protein
MAQSHAPRSIAVLVVDDEPLLLYDAVDMIEQAGFTTYAARNADEAVRLLERHPDIRVLFTDIDMPGSMDGLKLAHAVRDRWPPVTVMVTSGVQRIAARDLPAEGLFFPKPYPSAAIIRTLKSIADRMPG